ncbi:class I SAM-dependent methyltransferase [Mesorhizobium sp. IMUNJ 23232]|uniref:class I SAM-dependent methyltransferase n=1 Tax=Mesorhizobium sp. IMUNJ 23232 TaxID=3376064 RepID=UPI00379C329E
MTDKIPPRLLWAARQLAFDGTADLLEVGCGHGVLAGLVCERLAAGSLVAIDRSAKMIAAAQKRNAADVAAGRVSFHAAEFADANFGGMRFDRIFAVNVNVFWIDPRRELEAVRRLSKPGAWLDLFYEPPGVAQAGKINTLLSEKLTACGFEITARATEPLGTAVGIHVRAQPVNA